MDGRPDQNTIHPADDRVIDAAAAPKTVHVKSYGCQMNVYDSERMVEALAPLGFRETADAARADLIILNTCHIREKAAEKVYSELGRLRDLKAERSVEGRPLQIAVAGCVAQAEGGQILAREPAVDLVVGPQSLHRLPRMLRSLEAGSRQLIDTEFPDEDKFAALPKRTKRHTVSAFLTVQEGCDKFCTFCVVPYTRGMEISRPVTAIEEEAVRLVAGGAAELTLLGQNVNGYHGEGPDGRPWTLASLVTRLARIDGLQRLRYMTSHPRDMSEDLIEAHRDIPKLMPFLHLPVQSGSDRILAAMNRKHTAADYIRIIEQVRAARPDIALSTDIIVGFPGETDADFEATLRLIETIGYAQSFSFKFSARPGTPAASIKPWIEEDVKSERLARAQHLLNAQQAAYNAAAIGRVRPVLFEKPGRNEGQIVGRTPELQPVHVTGPRTLIGETRPVMIETKTSFSLGGRLIEA